MLLYPLLLNELAIHPLKTQNGVRKNEVEGYKTLSISDEGYDRSTSASFVNAHRNLTNEKEFHMEIDLPGVKLEDITLTVEGSIIDLRATRRHRSSDGETIKKSRIVKTFSIDDKTVDITKIHASLIDGVLSIQAPKRKPELRSIAVTNTPHTVTQGNNPDNHHDHSTEFVLEVDLPGVKANDVSLTIEDGTISIRASRQVRTAGINSSKASIISKSYSIDETHVDLSKIKANLADGVLVLTAPKKNDGKSVSKAIPITTETGKEKVNVVTVDEKVETTEEKKNTEE